MEAGFSGMPRGTGGPMIADFQTNTVCISDRLGQRYPCLVLGLEAILR